MRNIDQANVSQNRKLQFAKEVLEGYLQYEDCVSVLKAVMREIYNPQPKPPVSQKASTEHNENKPNTSDDQKKPTTPNKRSIPTRFLKPKQDDTSTNLAPHKNNPPKNEGEPTKKDRNKGPR